MSTTLKCLRIWLLVTTTFLHFLAFISLIINIWIITSLFEIISGDLALPFIFVLIFITIYSMVMLFGACSGGLAATYDKNIEGRLGCFLCTSICLFIFYIFSAVTLLVLADRINGDFGIRTTGISMLVYAIFYLHNTILSCCICSRTDKYQMLATKDSEKEKNTVLPISDTNDPNQSNREHNQGQRNQVQNTAQLSQQYNPNLLNQQLRTNQSNQQYYTNPVPQQYNPNQTPQQHNPNHQMNQQYIPVQINQQYIPNQLNQQYIPVAINQSLQPTQMIQPINPANQSIKMQP